MSIFFTFQGSKYAFLYKNFILVKTLTEARTVEVSLIICNTVQYNAMHTCPAQYIYLFKFKLLAPCYMELHLLPMLQGCTQCLGWLHCMPGLCCTVQLQQPQHLHDIIHENYRVSLVIIYLSTATATATWHHIWELQSECSHNTPEYSCSYMTSYMRTTEWV